MTFCCTEGVHRIKKENTYGAFIATLTVSLHWIFLHFDLFVVFSRETSPNYKHYSAFIIFDLPTIVFGFVLPVWMKLSHVLLRDEIEIFLVDFLAFGVMVDPAFSIALNHVLPKQPDCLVGNLSLTSTLLGRQQELYRILGTSSLCNRVLRREKNKMYVVSGEWWVVIASPSKKSTKKWKVRYGRSCQAWMPTPIETFES